MVVYGNYVPLAETMPLRTQYIRLVGAPDTTPSIYPPAFPTEVESRTLSIVLGSYTSSPRPVQLKLDLSNYRFMNETMMHNVRNFIYDNPQVERELLRARPIIREVFGDSALLDLELKISEDPDYPTLNTAICYIHTSLDIDVAEVEFQSFYKAFLNPPSGPAYKGGGIADHKLIIDLYLD